MSRPPKPALKHIALLVGGYVKREGISASELGRRVGIEKAKASVASGWALGQYAPSVLYRAKLASFLKVDEAELMPREAGKALTAARVAQDAQARALEAHLQAPSTTPAAVIAPRKAQDVLAYTVASDGQAELRVLARGPHARMSVVFRMLLDAGLVPGGEEEDA
jgi:transcriptional regulator with XRE-family HTH domain